MPYTEMAQANDLAWATFEKLIVATKAFLDPAFAGHGGTWHPEAWTWE